MTSKNTSSVEKVKKQLNFIVSSYSDLPYAAAQNVRREMIGYIFENNPDVAVIALNEMLK